jgi:hypothetical protein
MLLLELGFLATNERSSNLINERVISSAGISDFTEVAVDKAVLEKRDLLKKPLVFLTTLTLFGISSTLFGISSLTTLIGGGDGDGDLTFFFLLGCCSLLTSSSLRFRFL